jgi:hypothetical protein
MAFGIGATSDFRIGTTILLLIAGLFLEGTRHFILSLGN